ncbi:MAG: sugar ABC transporter permease [Chloroflexi bacterium]|nr:sugar ABC transporter permease [Chloroflexota bacterium]
MKRLFVKQSTPYLLLIPSILFLIIFFAFPMVESFSLSFRNPDGEWGLETLRTMVTDVAFWPALRTTIILTIIIIPIQFVLALIMALVIQAKLKGTGFFLYTYSIPLAISELAAGIVWFAIFTDRGFLNTWLVQLGLISKPFLFLSYQNTGWLIFTVMMAEVWRSTAIVMVILVSGLQSIPKDYLEAAEVFGANLWQKISRLILPLLKPSIQVALILRTIFSLQVFATAMALAGRGMSLLASESYRWYVDYQNENVAAAYAALIMVLSIISSVFYLVTLRTKPEQEMAV